MERGRATPGAHRLCESQQLRHAALHGATKRLLQSRGTRGRDHSDEPAPWRHGGGQRRRFLRHALTSTFRGILQGFPMKLVFIHLKKGPYYVMVRPEIKDVQQLKGKKLGV